MPRKQAVFCHQFVLFHSEVHERFENLLSFSQNTTVIDPVTNETVISKNINDNPDLDFYMQVYGIIIIVILLTSLLRCVIFTKVTVRASEILHKNMYSKMICSPMRYFETTPLGRIQNLFSRDLDEGERKIL